MSGTHALDQTPRIVNWELVRQRTADTLRHIGRGALGTVQDFETYMASRSLRGDRLGAEALGRYVELGVDPQFARAVEARLAE